MTMDNDKHLYQEFESIVNERKCKGSFKKKIQKLTQRREDVVSSSSLINHIFLSFRMHTKQIDEVYFKVKKKDFEDWKKEKGIKKLSHRNFTRIFKKLHLFPELHELASRGGIDVIEKVELWKKISSRISKFSSSSSYNCVQNIQNIQEELSHDFIMRFQELHTLPLSFTTKIKKLTENGDSSFRNKIFRSFVQFPGQIDRKRTIELRKDKSEEWKKVLNMNLFKLSVHTFRKIYKKVYIHEELHRFCSLGYIQSQLYIEKWNTIRNHIEEIQSKEDVELIIKTYNTKSSDIK